MGTRLLTYATPAIETAMKDCAARSSFSLSLPLDRYYQLRQVAFLYATHEQDAEAEILTAIQEKLEVSAKVAKRLLEEYHTVFQIESLGERVFDISFGGDPARAYDHFMRRTLLLQRMVEVLKPREYTYVGPVSLAATPYMEQQCDQNGNARSVCIFPLKMKDTSF